MVMACTSEVPDPKKWSAEQSNLYQLGVYLSDADTHLYDLKAFDQATHTNEVKETDQVTLNLDHVQMGLGRR